MDFKELEKAIDHYGLDVDDFEVSPFETLDMLHHVECLQGQVITRRRNGADWEVKCESLVEPGTLVAFAGPCPTAQEFFPFNPGRNRVLIGRGSGYAEDSSGGTTTNVIDGRRGVRFVYTNDGTGLAGGGGSSGRTQHAYVAGAGNTINVDNLPPFVALNWCIKR